MPDRVVLLNSGGIDSRVSAALLAESGMEVHSLTVDWNPYAREAILPAAQATADTYCASHTVLDFPVDWMRWSDLLKKKRMPYTVYVVLGLGAQYAVTLDATWIATGNRKGTSKDPLEWLEIMHRAINQSRVSPEMTILSPVFHLPDEDVDALAKSMSVDLTTTYSCSVYPACGDCVSCARRRVYGL